MKRIDAGEVLVADGAIGTMLLAEGIGPGSCLEILNVENPSLVEKILARYVAAGADLIQTNTLGGSPSSLARHGLHRRSGEVNGAAVRVARRAAGDTAYVYGSCGACGRLLEPFGNAKPDEIRDGFVRQIGAMAEEGIDLVVIETMTDVAEAVLAIRAAREAAPGVPVAATLTYDETPRGFFTIMGNSLASSVRAIETAGADIAGSNCGNGVGAMLRITRELRSACGLPLLVQPNAGLPRLEGETAAYPEGPDLFAEMTPRFVEAGVAILGGCCGTTPDHTGAMRRSLREVRP